MEGEFSQGIHFLCSLLSCHRLAAFYQWQEHLLGESPLHRLSFGSNNHFYSLVPSNLGQETESLENPQLFSYSIANNGVLYFVLLVSCYTSPLYLYSLKELPSIAPSECAFSFLQNLTSDASGWPHQGKLPHWSLSWKLDNKRKLIIYFLRHHMFHFVCYNRLALPQLIVFFFHEFLPFIKNFKFVGTNSASNPFYL